MNRLIGKGAGKPKFTRHRQEVREGFRVGELVELINEEEVGNPVRFGLVASPENLLPDFCDDDAAIFNGRSRSASEIDEEDFAIIHCFRDRQLVFGVSTAKKRRKHCVLDVLVHTSAHRAFALFVNRLIFPVESKGVSIGQSCNELLLPYRVLQEVVNVEKTGRDVGRQKSVEDVREKLCCKGGIIDALQE